MTMTTSGAPVSIVVMTVLVLLVATAGNAGELLRFKFIPEQELTYDVWVTGTGNLSFTGLPIPTEEGAEEGRAVQIQFNANGNVSLPVKSVDEDGNATVGLRFGALRLQGEAQGESVHIVIDLEQGTVEVNGTYEQMPDAQMQQMLGWLENLTVDISPQGKILNISGLPPIPPGGSGLGDFPMLGKTEDWQELLTSVPAAFPEGPVEVGDSWNSQIPIIMPGIEAEQLPQLTLECTLADVGQIEGHRVANIAFHGRLAGPNLSIELPVPAEKAEEATQLNLDFEETLDGNMYFDLDAGQVHRERANLSINLSFELPLPEEAAEFLETAPSMQMSLRLHFVVSPG